MRAEQVQKHQRDQHGEESMSAPGVVRAAPKRLLDRAVGMTPESAAIMPEGAVMSREKAQALVQKVVKMSKADGISVSVDSSYTANIRFAANQMSTAGGVIDSQIGIESTF
jgi:hypothetical protein